MKAKGDDNSRRTSIKTADSTPAWQVACKRSHNDVVSPERSVGSRLWARTYRPPDVGPVRRVSGV